MSRHIVLFIVLFGFFKMTLMQNSTTTLSSSSKISTLSTTTRISSSPSTSFTGSTFTSHSTVSNLTSSTSSTISTSSTPSVSTSQSTASSSISPSNFITDSITSPFWIQTGCDIDVTIDTTNSTFRSDMEGRLLRAYASAISARLSSTGRRRRAATNGVNTLQLVGVSRITAGQRPSLLVYYVKNNANAFVPASEAIAVMNQLSPQQMSILLGVPVTNVASYFNAALESPNVDQKLWIIGAVFGSLAGAAFIVWLVLFIYSRCIRPWDEPLLDNTDLESSGYSYNYKNSEPIIYPAKKSQVVEKSMHHTNLNGIEPKKVHKTEDKFTSTTTKKDDILVIREIEHVEKKQKKKKPRKHSSGSSEDSTHKSSSDVKKSNSEKHKEKSDHESEHSKDKKKSKEKHKKKDKHNSTISNSEIVEEHLVKTRSKAIMESPTKIEKDVITSVDDDHSLMVKEMKELLKSDGTSINLIEVKPRASPNELQNFELLQPVPFVDHYSSIHLFPKYSNENLIIPDTTLNLVELKETDALEKHRTDMNNAKSIKSHLRTLEPLPRRPHKMANQTSTDELINSLKSERKEAKGNTEKRS